MLQPNKKPMQSTTKIVLDLLLIALIILSARGIMSFLLSITQYTSAGFSTAAQFQIAVATSLMAASMVYIYINIMIRRDAWIQSI